ncbi:MAG: hypothetical protein HC927_12645 [Deltaproteobacteria bacterium]|nr:hypothetical protein [Deltaproteobacteria bacterium]
MGETIAAGDHHQGSCATNPAPEREYWWVAPFAGSFAITTAGSDLDTVVYVREGGCEGRELACNDDTVTPLGTELWSTVTVELDAGQTISIFVDGYNGAGEFELGISEL